MKLSPQRRPLNRSNNATPALDAGDTRLAAVKRPCGAGHFRRRTPGSVVAPSALQTTYMSRIGQNSFQCGFSSGRRHAGRSLSKNPIDEPGRPSPNVPDQRPALSITSFSIALT